MWAPRAPRESDAHPGGRSLRPASLRPRQGFGKSTHKACPTGLHPARTPDREEQRLPKCTKPKGRRKGTKPALRKGLEAVMTVPHLGISLRTNRVPVTWGLKIRAVSVPPIRDKTNHSVSDKEQDKDGTGDGQRRRHRPPLLRWAPGDAAKGMDRAPQPLCSSRAESEGGRGTGCPKSGQGAARSAEVTDKLKHRALEETRPPEV